MVDIKYVRREQHVNTTTPDHLSYSYSTIVGDESYPDPAVLTKVPPHNDHGFDQSFRHRNPVSDWLNKLPPNMVKLMHAPKVPISGSTK